VYPPEDEAGFGDDERLWLIVSIDEGSNSNLALKK
jgi:hypothetical protein